MPPDELERLRAACESAWGHYNAAARGPGPGEAHQAWKQRIWDARTRHQAALRDYDRAACGPRDTGRPEGRGQENGT